VDITSCSRYWTVRGCAPSYAYASTALCPLCSGQSYQQTCIWDLHQRLLRSWSLTFTA